MSFDYGELSARSDFSIRVYQEHQTFPLFDEALNRSEAFGKTDITYDVNFTHVKEAYEALGSVCAVRNPVGGIGRDGDTRFASDAQRARRR
jgi:SAM-dependent MidA family methyltransferase